MIGTVEAAVVQMREMRRLYALALQEALFELEGAGLEVAAGKVRNYLWMIQTGREHRPLRSKPCPAQSVAMRRVWAKRRVAKEAGGRPVTGARVP